jgi:hypothetical protein
MTMQAFDEAFILAHTVDGVALIPPGHYKAAAHPLALPAGLTVRGEYPVTTEPDENRWSVIHFTRPLPRHFVLPTTSMTLNGMPLSVTGLCLVDDRPH